MVTERGRQQRTPVRSFLAYISQCGIAQAFKIRGGRHSNQYYLDIATVVSICPWTRLPFECFGPVCVLGCR